MLHRRPHHLWIALCALATLGISPIARGEDESPFKDLAAYRVYPRDRNDEAKIPIVLTSDAQAAGAKILDVDLFGVSDGAAVNELVDYADGSLVGVPVGGPYSVVATLATSKGDARFVIGPIFVGDLWVLAGQSNMQGVGELLDVTPPNDQVMLLGMDGEWGRAEEPLHWLVDSPDSVHSGDPVTREHRSANEHKSRSKGAGLGLPFAVEMVKATHVPVGLVACAHGGTSMEQWNPNKKDEGGKSLYGSMMRQFQLAGGKARGVLWYQGESDANEKAAAMFEKAFTDFIAAVRSDFKQPDLPFYYVQIGRFTIRNNDPKPWNTVQDIQRRLVERIPNTAVVPVIDLPLDDAIHVGTPGLKRAGQRLARVALHELYGQPGGSTPTLDRVARGPGNSIVIKLKGVNTGDPDEYGLRPERHIGGFSLRKDDGTEIPLIFDVVVGPSKDTVIVKLDNKLPEGANLWYGWGYDPYCNLTDSTDMAVPVFGPIPLDEVK